ncbi:hypothetical protein PPL_09287 [Heterostelium album PN500]|uniref:Uncharacterized protein n=1 Tax=Heterostelium pallidum (strain ATCC 26659 / Pp 5 / PN500) TaxID=670386 RepID=D3BL55_HETP5|nr:hypothetical protein PPL_09287 [Heterostelium album PN500]EFA77789.1 hypothetical protein PPL_09287 [Heterostelium album PN500]|eukprot:XP_020429917.1 hypothetical protein PPL_09287 [Heterostelium album PN500]
MSEEQSLDNNINYNINRLFNENGENWDLKSLPLQHLQTIDAIIAYPDDLQLFDNKYNVEIIHKIINLSLYLRRYFSVENHRVPHPDFLQFNRSLFKNIDSINKLYAVCETNELLSVINIYFKHYLDSIKSLDSFEDVDVNLMFYLYKVSKQRNFLKYITLESICIDRINNDTTLSDTVRFNLILIVMYYKRTLITDLHQHHQLVLEMIIKLMSSKMNSYYHHQLSVFNEYFKVNESNMLVVQECFKQNRFKSTMDFIYSTFYRFISTPEDIYKQISKLGLESHYYLMLALPTSYLKEEKTANHFIKNISFSNLDSFILPYLYHQKGIDIPEALYDHIVKISLKFEDIIKSMDIASKIERYHHPRFQETIVQSFVSLYNQKKDPMFILISFYLMTGFRSLSSSFSVATLRPHLDVIAPTFVNKTLFMLPQFQLQKHNIELWTLVSVLLNKEQISLLLEKAPVDMQFKFVLSTSNPYQSLVTLLHILRTTVGSTEGLNQVFKQLYLQVDNCQYLLEALSFFLDNNVTSLWDGMHRYKNLSLLMEKLKANGREYFDKLIKVIQVNPYINILLKNQRQKDKEFLKYIPDSKYYIDEQQQQLQDNHLVNNNVSNNSNNNICIESSAPPTIILNPVILKYIIELVIVQPHSKSKWLVELSTVSKLFHQICSKILSNGVNQRVKIKSSIGHIGSTFCLFSNPPLHLRSIELEFIPREHLHSCLENLESLTQYFWMNQMSYTTFNIHMIEAKNLKHIKFYEKIYEFERIGVECKDLYRMVECTLNPYDNTDTDTDTDSHSDMAVQSSESHFFQVLLDHYNNDRLQSIEYDSCRSGLETQAHYHSLPLLSQLKHQKSIDVNASLDFSDISFKIGAKDTEPLTKVVMSDLDMLFLMDAKINDHHRPKSEVDLKI